MTPSKETYWIHPTVSESSAKLWRNRVTQILLVGVPQPLWKVIWQVLVKLKTHIPFDSAVPRLDIILEQVHQEVGMGGGVTEASFVTGIS